MNKLEYMLLDSRNGSEVACLEKDIESKFEEGKSLQNSGFQVTNNPYLS